MISKLFFLACLALAQATAEGGGREMVFSERCPPIHHHWLLPHEWDCTKFYYCEYGMKWVTPRDCAPGTEFSYQLQVCVHPIFANCDLPGPPTNPPSTTTTTTTTTTTRPTTTTTTTAPTTTTTTAAPTTTTTTAAPTTTTTTAVPTTTTTASTCNTRPPTTTTTQTTPAGECPTDFDVHQLLPHANCSKFYYCVFGEKVERDCPPGLHFNPILQVCDWPWDAGCEGATPSTTTTATGPTTTTTSSPPGDNKCAEDCNVLPWAHETDCDSFWMCDGKEKVLVRCSLGLHFNPDKGSCDYICNAGCLTDVRESL